MSQSLLGASETSFTCSKWINFLLLILNNLLTPGQKVCLKNVSLWDFSYIFYFPNFLGLKSVGKSFNKLVILDIKFRFSLWRIGPVLKNCKDPKYFDQDSLKIICLISALPIMIKLSGKSASFGSKKLIISRNYR